jgi:hypothetical protein
LNRNRVREKGRAGGRARRPARPLAGEPIHVSEATVANGVVSSYVIIRLSWPWSSRCSSSGQRDEWKANRVPEDFGRPKRRAPCLERCGPNSPIVSSLTRVTSSTRATRKSSRSISMKPRARSARRLTGHARPRIRHTSRDASAYRENSVIHQRIAALRTWAPLPRICAKVVRWSLFQPARTTSHRFVDSR